VSVYVNYNQDRARSINRTNGNESHIEIVESSIDIDDDSNGTNILGLIAFG
jgi:hypothetical protein